MEADTISAFSQEKVCVKVFACKRSCFRCKCLCVCIVGFGRVYFYFCFISFLLNKFP